MLILLTSNIDLHTAKCHEDNEDEEKRAISPRVPMNSVETLVLEALSELETPPLVHM